MIKCRCHSVQNMAGLIWWQVMEESARYITIASDILSVWIYN